MGVGAPANTKRYVECAKRGCSGDTTFQVLASSHTTTRKKAKFTAFCLHSHTGPVRKRSPSGEFPKKLRFYKSPSRHPHHFDTKKMFGQKTFVGVFAKNVKFLPYFFRGYPPPAGLNRGIMNFLIIAFSLTYPRGLSVHPPL